MASASRQRDPPRRRAIQNKRSSGWSRRWRVALLSTATCWRRARFSRTRSERERPRARRVWNRTFSRNFRGLIAGHLGPGAASFQGERRLAAGSRVPDPQQKTSMIPSSTNFGETQGKKQLQGPRSGSVHAALSGSHSSEAPGFAGGGVSQVDQAFSIAPSGPSPPV